MQIGEAAAASGLSEDTIRFYERHGVLPAPPRHPNGYRDYTDDHVETLRFARGLRELGLPPSEMADIVAVAHDGTCGALRSALIDRIARATAELDERIAGLEHTRRHLDGLGKGLRRMRPREQRVPGRPSCTCVALVQGGDGPRPRA